MTLNKENITNMSLLKYIFFNEFSKFGITVTIVIIFVRFMAGFILNCEEIVLYLLISSYITSILSGHKWVYYKNFNKNHNGKLNILRYIKMAFIKGFILFGIPVTCIGNLSIYLHTNDPISYNRLIVGYIFISCGLSFLAMINWKNE